MMNRPLNTDEILLLDSSPAAGSPEYQRRRRLLIRLGISTSAAGVSRDPNYMRDYMRRYRAEKKASPAGE